MAEAFPLGNWKNFKEMEESLTLDELYLLIKTQNDVDYTRRKFDAAIQGIDLEEETEDTSSFDAVREQADAILGNVTEEQVQDLFGLNDTDEDDE